MEDSAPHAAGPSVGWGSSDVQTANHVGAFCGVSRGSIEIRVGGREGQSFRAKLEEMVGEGVEGNHLREARMGCIGMKGLKVYPPASTGFTSSHHLLLVE